MDSPKQMVTVMETSYAIQYKAITTCVLPLQKAAAETRATKTCQKESLPFAACILADVVIAQRDPEPAAASATPERVGAT